MHDFLKENNSKKTAVSLYFEELSKDKYEPIKDTKEEVRIFKMYKYFGNREAYEMIFNSNLRFVVKLARNMIRPYMPLIDRIQEGNIGFMMGLERFDETRGVRIVSYVDDWIKKEINEAWMDYYAGNIRRPRGMIEDLIKIRKVAEEFMANHDGLKPVNEVLVKELNRKYSNDDKTNYNEKRLSDVAYTEYSLYEKWDNDSNTLLDIIEDPNVEDLTLEADKESQDQVVRELLNSLDEIDVNILEMYFKINREFAMNNSDIAERVDLTYVAVIVRKKRALRNLNYGNQASYLRQHMLE